MKRLSLSIVLCLLCPCHHLLAQTRAEFRRELSEIDSEYHEQAGFNMAISLQYEADMDSLLNEVYQVVQSSHTPAEKAAMNAQERRWIKERDAIFKKDQDAFDRKYRGGFPHDEQMILFDKHARFIRSRVLYLIKCIKP